MATKYESEEKSNQFQEWCLLELMGHQRIAGLVSEAVIGGVNLLRVDVPEVKGIAGYTRYFSGAAVYSLNPVTEELAGKMAESLRAAPIQRYELPRMGSVGYGYAPSEQEEAEEDRRDSGRDSVPF